MLPSLGASAVRNGGADAKAGPHPQVEEAGREQEPSARSRAERSRRSRARRRRRGGAGGHEHGVCIDYQRGRVGHPIELRVCCARSSTASTGQYCEHCPVQQPVLTATASTDRLLQHSDAPKPAANSNPQTKPQPTNQTHNCANPCKPLLVDSGCLRAAAGEIKGINARRSPLCTRNAGFCT